MLGQFKAGKSSFLNGYINRILLPVGSIQVTSVITRLRYGTADGATVAFEDGLNQVIPFNELPEYVSESKNPENVKSVLLVDIETPTLSRIKTLRLVDTPGLGSIWKHNTETTGWFPETFLLLISAEKPISESELNLLKELCL